jgi:CRP/FNR family transcriptional regulator
VEVVERGRLLVGEGEPADELGIIAAGKVRVFHLAADGRRFAFEDLAAPEPFAVPAALSGGRYPASVEAVTPAEIVWLPREALFELLEREPKVARTLVSDLARRVVTLTEVAQTLALDVPARLARFLFQRSLETGRPTERGLVIDIGMSKAELAEALGTVPETLSRALARMREDGLIEVEGREVRVFDVGALARMGSSYEEG